MISTQRVSLPDAELRVRIEGDGPPLLLVHGFPLDHTMWSAQIEAISRVRWIAPDLRGFGQSRGALPEPLTMARMADDLAGLLDALEITQPIDICGLSMGGYIALEFWNRYPHRLARIMFCDTRAAADTPVTAKGREIGALNVLADGTAPLAEAMIAKLFAEATLTEQPDVIERTRQVIVETAVETVAAALRGMAVRADFSQRLGEIDIPALVICGSDDLITPVKEMKTMADALPSADFVEIPGAGHLAPLERPAIVNRAIEEFCGT